MTPYLECGGSRQVQNRFLPQRQAKWEMVARMHAGGRDWIVPVSQGRHYRRSWLVARWWVWRRTRAHRPLMTWEIRRSTGKE